MWLDILLIITLLICTITDLRSRRIYNKVIFPALLASLSIHLLSGGWNGLFLSILGLLVGLLLLTVPYLMGGIGAGDVKLLGVIGSIKGVSFVLYTSLYMAMIGGLIALLILLFRKGLLQRIKTIGYFLGSLRCGIKTPIWMDRKSHQITYPYGVAIALGALVSLIGNGWF